ncbi:hypothetical protein FLACHUCJ7_03696 [Flavobacterium chungangense]|uniref:Penicillin-binding protein activator LpoB n=2 Tax=Flavobacterium chungangense TaxID=554283 RepID=A0A6V6ZBD7_9FLAO|nr:hypothetical protein FLACHUCJ7_03696 [Flavobacterium chungangense]
MLSLFSCATKSNFSKNNLNQEYFNGKTIVFSINENSVKNIKKSGPRAGIERRPDINETFNESVAQLAKETKINLKVKYFKNQTANVSDINVEAEITDISWMFDLSSATMVSTINYKIGNKIYKKVGLYKNMSGGSEKKNLIRSLKTAHYSLLQELQK